MKTERPLFAAGADFQLPALDNRPVNLHQAEGLFKRLQKILLRHTVQGKLCRDFLKQTLLLSEIIALRAGEFFPEPCELFFAAEVAVFEKKKLLIAQPQKNFI